MGAKINKFCLKKLIEKTLLRIIHIGFLRSILCNFVFFYKLNIFKYIKSSGNWRGLKKDI
jgi:hypothetical protein